MPKDGRKANNVILREDELMEKRIKAERSIKKKALNSEDFFEGKESLRAQFAKNAVRFGIKGNPNQKKKM